MTKVHDINAVEFLREIIPFNSLPEEVILEICDQLRIQEFPKDSLIFQQDGPPCEYLYMIRRGAVIKSVQRDGADVLFDFRTEGEVFGSASLVAGTGPAFSVRAYEDTVCYLLPKAAFDALMQNHVGFHEHFAIRVSRLSDRLKKAQSGIFSLPSGSDVLVLQEGRPLFGGVSAGELIKSKPVTCSPYHEATYVAKLMARHQIGAVVVVDLRNRPLGIVTKTDMTNKILAAEKTGAEPVRTIMSAPVIGVSPEEPAFNALLKMAGRGFHHVCVVVGEMLLGVISQHDLITLQGADPLAVINRIEAQDTLDGLVEPVQSLDALVEHLLEAGVEAKQVAGFISECNDRLTRRIIALSQEAMLEEGLGAVPGPYCWLALGSEGRKEQALRTDQDNAIIYADPEPGSQDRVQTYYLELGRRVVSGLERCGFPLCKGEIMASNPQWCCSETAWRTYFSKWINDASPEDLRKCTIFFDFRGLEGVTGLADGLRDFLHGQIEANRAFLRHLTTNALYNGPPLGFLRSLVVEKKGVHKNKLNLKMSGLVPVVDAVRVFALSRNIDATNTLKRLDLVRRSHLLSHNMAADVQEAFSFIMLLRMNRHLSQKKQDLAPDDYINPEELPKLQKRSLIEAFHVIRDLQGEMAARFPESL
ncbi:MAG: cyclic nucleotide-binding/CBS domain-containing protein [Deltaproteobacteria bacterium]|nr:cyclic nucleotide-binding/CBS domain-containing protein [Deltaproteobacteria bacterium]